MKQEEATDTLRCRVLNPEHDCAEYDESKPRVRSAQERVRERR